MARWSTPKYARLEDEQRFVVAAVPDGARLAAADRRPLPHRHAAAAAARDRRAPARCASSATRCARRGAPLGGVAHDDATSTRPSTRASRPRGAHARQAALVARGRRVRRRVPRHARGPRARRGRAALRAAAAGAVEVTDDERFCGGALAGLDASGAAALVADAKGGSREGLRRRAPRRRGRRRGPRRRRGRAPRRRRRRRSTSRGRASTSKTPWSSSRRAASRDATCSSAASTPPARCSRSEQRRVACGRRRSSPTATASARRTTAAFAPAPALRRGVADAAPRRPRRARPRWSSGPRATPRWPSVLALERRGLANDARPGPRHRRDRRRRLGRRRPARRARASRSWR